MATGYDITYPDGLVRQGNLDITKPIAIVKQKDGTVATVKTMSFGTDRGEVVIPTVHPDGYIMSNEEAIAYFRKTGKNFGTFDSIESATQFAQSLHEYQAGFEEVQNAQK